MCLSRVLRGVCSLIVLVRVRMSQERQWIRGVGARMLGWEWVWPGVCLRTRRGWDIGLILAELIAGIAVEVRVLLWEWNECWSMFLSSVLFDGILLLVGIGELRVA